MPKVNPLGSGEMKKNALAKHRAQAEFRDPDAIRNRIDSLQKAAGCSTQARFAEKLGISYARLRSIRDNPENVTLKEAIFIQSMASQYGFTVFHIDIGGKTND